MRAIGFVLASLLTACAFADKPNVVGRYRWIAPADVVQFAKSHDTVVPSSYLTLGEKGVFRYVTTDDQGSENVLGTYAFDGTTIVLKIETGEGIGLPLKLKWEGDKWTAKGTSFLRLRSDSDKAAPAAPVAAPAGGENEATGSWTLRRKAGEDKTVRWTFGKDGKFRYVGGGGLGCAGTYRFTDDGIEVTYLEIDGEKQEPGAIKPKVLPWLDGKTAFQVDTYRFERASA